MAQALVILVFVMLHAAASESGGVAPGSGLAPWAVGVGTITPIVLVALVAHGACVVLGRRMDRGSWRAAFGAQRIVGVSRVAMIVHFGFSLFVLGWLGAVRRVVGDLWLVDELIAVLPPLAGAAAGWWSLYPIDRRQREALLWRRLADGEPMHRPPTRPEYVVGAVRHQLLLLGVPLTILTAWQELVEIAIRRAGLEGDGALLAQAAGGVAGAVLVFLGAPMVLRRVWDTVEIEGGECAEIVRDLCARHRVRFRRPLLWRTHGSMVNAAVLGLLPPFRYVLFSDALLERLSARQVRAVAAHEIGHVRHHHILWLAGVITGTITLVELACARVLHGAGLAGPSEPAGWMIPAGAALLAGFWVFGYASRRFEWQADAFAARDLSLGDAAGGAGARVTPDGAGVVASALTLVAGLNGIDPSRPSFRHGSIDERVRRLGGLAGLDASRLPVDRVGRRIKLWALASWAIVAGWVAASAAGLFGG